MVIKEGTKVVTVRLHEDDKFEFEKEAHKENRSLNNFIVNAVKVYIRQKKVGVANKCYPLNYSFLLCINS